MTCSKNSSPQEYKVFQQWGQRVLPKEISLLIPTWEMVENWRGKGVAVCDYTATTNSGPMIWNEGYPYWWELSNVHLLQCPIPCKGNVGMWVMSPELSSEVEVQLAKL
jgi:hypothetical protein